ncbi:MAG: hypothetical protein M3Z21_11735, partial [Pseudomonadota bacterium]|nr:hypothetical protein [Pseudomonadota bacterium]
MLNAMRELALLELNRRFGLNGASLDQLRHEHGQDIAPLLVEASEKINRVYLLQAVPGQPGVVRMWSEELDDDKRRRLPFNKPSGSQSPAIGPVLKRTYKPKDRPPFGPSLRIQRTTQDAFDALAGSQTPWSSYFQEAGQALFYNARLAYQEQICQTGDGAADPHPLAAAIRLIPDKETVFVSVADAQGRWPGDCPEYHAYLAHALADIK